MGQAGLTKILPDFNNQLKLSHHLMLFKSQERLYFYNSLLSLPSTVSARSLDDGCRTESIKGSDDNFKGSRVSWLALVSAVGSGQVCCNTQVTIFKNDPSHRQYRCLDAGQQELIQAGNVKSIDTIVDDIQDGRKSRSRVISECGHDGYEADWVLAVRTNKDVVRDANLVKGDTDCLHVGKRRLIEALGGGTNWHYDVTSTAVLQDFLALYLIEKTDVRVPSWRAFTETQAINILSRFKVPSLVRSAKPLIKQGILLNRFFRTNHEG
jgi:hypothetical protein